MDFKVLDIKLDIAFDSCFAFSEIPCGKPRGWGAQKQGQAVYSSWMGYVGLSRDNQVSRLTQRPRRLTDRAKAPGLPSSGLAVRSKNHIS